MTLQLEIDRVAPAIWRSVGWPFGIPKGIIIHSTRSGQPNRVSKAGHDLEMSSTINWFQSQNSRASANIIISPNETVQAVSDDRYAWHAKQHSPFTLSIELTQALTENFYYEEQYERAAAVCHVWCKNFDIPKVYMPRYFDGMRGLSGHEDTEQGINDGKSDPGPNWDWIKFINMLRGLDNMPNQNLEQRIKASVLFNEVVANMLEGVIPTAKRRREIRYLLGAWKAKIGE